MDKTPPTGIPIPPMVPPPPPASMKTTLLKVAAIVVPLLVAATGYLYGDVVPLLRDICEALPPAGVLPARVQDALR